MHRPAKWWWGVLPVAGLWAVAAWTNTDAVKADLTSRATAAVSSLPLGKTQVSIDGRDATINASAFAADAVPKAGTNVDGTYGVRLVTNSIKLEPIFTAARDAATNTLMLNGFYLTEAQHAEILATANGDFRVDKIVDSMAAAPNVPDNLGAITATGMSQLSRLTDGTLQLKDHVLSLSGTALYTKAVAQITDAITQSVPPGYSVVTDIHAAQLGAPIDGPACQSLFTQLVAGTSIQFETASAHIDLTSSGLLDRLAAVALRCPAGNVEVQGYTDSDGDAAANLKLSQARADAVLQYLTAAGVDAKHLTAVGYGAANPIATNDTPEGKALNRRIAFVVK